MTLPSSLSQLTKQQNHHMFTHLPLCFQSKTKHVSNREPFDPGAFWQLRFDPRSHGRTLVLLHVSPYRWSSGFQRRDIFAFLVVVFFLAALGLWCFLFEQKLVLLGTLFFSVAEKSWDAGCFCFEMFFKILDSRHKFVLLPWTWHWRDVALVVCFFVGGGFVVSFD